MRYLKRILEQEERHHSQIASSLWTHVATHESNGHRIGSHDGITWHDYETGEKVGIA